MDHYNISRDIQIDYTYAFKVNYDFDNDNKDEAMYIVSNMFADHDVSSSYKPKTCIRINIWILVGIGAVILFIIYIIEERARRKRQRRHYNRRRRRL